MPKNQKNQKIPIQWSQKLTLVTYLLITFSKKNVQNFYRKKKYLIFFFFFFKFLGQNFPKKSPKFLSKKKIFDFFFFLKIFSEKIY